MFFAMLENGTIIAGRYEIIRKIGAGGMGSVFEGRHIHVGRRVAIKVLSEELSDDRDAVERFQREANIAGSIGHINICEVMDFGLTAQGLPFLVMEFLEGCSLGELIELEKRLPPERVLKLMTQVLDALEEAHLRGIIHRDLKPENIFITEIKGHGEVVKLLDFGISKITCKDTDAMNLTKSGMIVGTTYYMSPEQARMSKDADKRMDIYSCGVILYELITGSMPYQGQTFSEVIAQILEKPVPGIRSIVPDAPEALDLFVRRCMAKNPSERPQTAAEMKKEVEKILAGKASGVHEAVTKTITAHSLVSRAWKRWKLLAASLLAAGAAVAMTLILVASMAGSGDEGPPVSRSIHGVLAGAPVKKTLTAAGGRLVKPAPGKQGEDAFIPDEKKGMMKETKNQKTAAAKLKAAGKDKKPSVKKAGSGKSSTGSGGVKKPEVRWDYPGE